MLATSVSWEDTELDIFLYQQHLHAISARSLSFFLFRLILCRNLIPDPVFVHKEELAALIEYFMTFYDIWHRLYEFDHFSDLLLYCSWGVCFPVLHAYTSLMTLKCILLATAPSNALERFQTWVVPIVRALGVEISVADSRMS